MIFSAMTPEDRTIEIAKLDYEALKLEASDRLRIQESLGQSIIKSLTLVNGGALIALFTFIGNTGARLSFDLSALWIAFAFFVGGLSLAVIATFLAYLMQVQFYTSTMQQSWNQQSVALGGAGAYDHARAFRVGRWFEYSAVAAAILSLVAFVAGSGFGLAGVTG